MTRFLSRNKFLFFILLSWLFVLPIKAQELPDLGEKAERLFSTKQYSRASLMYLNLLKHQTSEKYTEHLAYCFLQMRDGENAENWYEKVLSFKKFDPMNIFYYAEALMQNGNYAKALFYFKQYFPYSVTNRSMVNSRIESCQIYGESNNDPSYYVRNEKSLNSAYSDFGMMNFGDKFLFSSDRVIDSTEIKNRDDNKKIYGWTGVPYLKLYKTTYSSTTNFSIPILEKYASNNFHTGSVAISPDRKRIYFTRSGTTKKSEPYTFKVVNDPSVNRLGLFYKDSIDGKWSEPKAFPYNDSLKYSTGHPALSPDGKTLYFASDMPGTMGGSDIFYSLIDSNKFSVPVNMGPKINSTGNEVFPYCDPKGTLYFSSDGRIGLGGLDIYKVTENKEHEIEIQNLGIPINSSKDDFGFNFRDSSRSKGFFASDRTGGAGKDDIYSFHFRFKPVLMVQVLRAQDLKPISGAEIRMDLETMIHPLLNSSLPADTEGMTLMGLANLKVSDILGRTSFLLDTNQNYQIKAYRRGIRDSACASVKVLKQSPDTLKLTLLLSDPIDVAPVAKNVVKHTTKVKPLIKNEKEPDQDNDLTEKTPMTEENLVKGKTFILKNFYYDLDKWNIRPDAARQLDKLFMVLQANSNIRIELNAHTDARGSDAYNNLLSQLRADAAVRYLSDKGISSQRLRARGYGKSKILNKCKTDVPCTEADHQQNRRTEVTIVE